MFTRTLTLDDLERYKYDIFDCYKCNPLVFDSQNIWKGGSAEGIKYFLSTYIESDESNLLGIFDEEQMFCFGIIIFDNIRFGRGNKSCAEVHIVTDKCLWGPKIREIYKETLESIPFTTLYCHIPSIAVHAIRMCKNLKFKKTGYIPDNLPYINNQGEERLYDTQIWSYQRR